MLHKRLEMPVHVIVFAAPPINFKKWWFLNFLIFEKYWKSWFDRFAEWFLNIKCEKNNILEAPCETGKSEAFFRENTIVWIIFISKNRSAKRNFFYFQYFSKILKILKSSFKKKYLGGGEAAKTVTCTGISSRLCKHLRSLDSRFRSLCGRLCIENRDFPAQKCFLEKIWWYFSHFIAPRSGKNDHFPYKFQNLRNMIPNLYGKWSFYRFAER